MGKFFGNIPFPDFSQSSAITKLLIAVYKIYTFVLQISKKNFRMPSSDSHTARSVCGGATKPLHKHYFYNLHYGICVLAPE